MNKMVVKVFSWVLLVFGCVHASVLPVEKCTLTDSICMTAAVQKMAPFFAVGMPEYNTEVLDPMALDQFKFDLSGLKFKMSNATLKGLTNVDIDNVDWNINKQIFTTEFRLDLNVKGAYKASGRVLILPITGDGLIKIKLRNLYVKLNIHYQLVKINDKEHVKPTKSTFEFELLGGAHFNLTNLFNGNKELSDVMLKFLNENWKEITHEFGGPLIETAVKRVYKNIATFLKKVPIEDIAKV